MKGKFILRTDRKTNSEGECAIYLQYTTLKKAVKVSTGYKVKPTQWNGDTGTDNYVNRNHPQCLKINKALSKLKKEKDSIIDKILEGNPRTVIPVEVLKSILDGTYRFVESDGKEPFIEQVLEENLKLYKRNKIGYSVYKNIECNMKTFRTFLTRVKHRTKPLLCCDVTSELIDEYIIWRKEERQNSDETINKALTPIFKTIDILDRKGWLDHNTCAEIKDKYIVVKGKNLGDDEDVKYLTDAEMKQLKKIASASKYQRTKDFVDMFFFSCYCCGLRFSDVATLRWSEVDLEKKTIKKYMVKGHTKKAVQLVLPLNAEAVKILNRWMGRNENFVFGLLPDEFDLNDDESLLRTLNSSNRCINTSLGCLGSKMELGFKLHFHIARHTFAVLALNKGIDIHPISTLMGHSSTMVTEKVYAKFLPDTIARIGEEKLNFSFD
jgi:integrase